MKKILVFLLITSAAILSPQISKASANPDDSTSSRVEYNSTTTAFVPQRRNRGRGRGRDDVQRVRYITRTVRQGRHLYRITYKVVSYHHGRTYTSVVRRVRIR
jgi:hypothetical protein